MGKTRATAAKPRYRPNPNNALFTQIWWLNGFTWQWGHDDMFASWTDAVAYLARRKANGGVVEGLTRDDVSNALTRLRLQMAKLLEDVAALEKFDA